MTDPGPGMVTSEFQPSEINPSLNAQDRPGRYIGPKGFFFRRLFDRVDEVAEKGVRPVGSGLELRMELSPHHPGMMLPYRADTPTPRRPGAA